MLKYTILVVSLALGVSGCETKEGNLLLGAGLAAGAIGTGLIIANNT